MENPFNEDYEETNSNKASLEEEEKQYAFDLKNTFDLDNRRYEEIQELNNYDAYRDLQDMQYALEIKNIFEKDFPNHMRRIFVKLDIIFKNTLEFIERYKLYHSHYFGVLLPRIEREEEFIFECRDENEVYELANLTFKLVISYGWKVCSVGLKIIASPPEQSE